MPESKQRTVHISYRRQVADGNYGTEAAEVSLEWFVPDGEDTHEDLDAAEEMLTQARDLVLKHLQGSLSEHVRRSVSPRTTKTPQVAPARAAVTVPAGDEDPF